MKLNMRRFGLLVTLLLTLSGTSPAAGADWAKNYGTAGSNAYTFATIVDASGNVYITGYFVGATLTLGDVTLTKIGVEDVFSAKLDSSGTVLWAKNYGGSGARARGFGIAVDVSGNVYLSGEFQTGNLTTPPLTQIGVVDTFAIKLDSDGNTTWAKNYGGSGAKAKGYGKRLTDLFRRKVCKAVTNLEFRLISGKTEDLLKADFLSLVTDLSLPFENQARITV